MDEKYYGNQEIKGSQNDAQTLGNPTYGSENVMQQTTTQTSVNPSYRTENVMQQTTTQTPENASYRNETITQQNNIPASANLYFSDEAMVQPEENKKNRKERRRQEKLQKKALKKEKRKHSFFVKAARMTAYGLVFGAAFGLAFQGIHLGKNYLLTGNIRGAQENGAENVNKEIQEVTLLTTKETDSSVAAVVNNVIPSIVSVTSTFEVVGYDFFFNQYSQESTGYGSGIIIGKSEDTLLVVTNYHVVEDAKEVAVGFIDSQYVTASVKGYDSDADLAVLSINLKDMKSSTIDSIKVAVLGDSEELLVGEQAIAIGNAMGYGQSVTVGYVSALNREVHLTDKTMTLLQTDAAINPGNSGGALLNSKGEVIGINTIKYSDTSVEGMGYAIPISDATPIINDLMTQEVIEEEDKAFLGVGGDTVTREYNERFGMPIGAYVSKVSDRSPAEKAGICAGDIITKIGDYEITSWEELQGAIEQYKGGDSVVIVLQRSNSKGQYKKKEIEVTFGYRSDYQ